MEKIKKINKLLQHNKYYFSAIDPGKNGAISIFKVENNDILPITVFNVPVSEIESVIRIVNGFNEL